MREKMPDEGDETNRERTKNINSMNIALPDRVRFRQYDTALAFRIQLLDDKRLPNRSLYHFRCLPSAATPSTAADHRTPRCRSQWRF